MTSEPVLAPRLTTISITMKRVRPKRLPARIIAGVFILTNTAFSQPVAAPASFCRFVPERLDDFAWENDTVAFRTYGPALRKGAENGGVDCWLKRVDYPIIDKWYKLDKAGKPYHTDHGEGYDPYHVGSSLGCGGSGLWIEGRLVNSETFVRWKIISSGTAESVFDLNYEWDFEGHAYKVTKRISIKLGERLFHTTAEFRKDGKVAEDLPVAIGVTTHDGKAKASADAKQGWLACWEKIDGFGLGTGAVMAPSRIVSYEEIQSKKPDESHALFVTRTDAKGQISWRAGYGWERAGGIKNLDEWVAYLKTVSKEE